MPWGRISRKNEIISIGGREKVEREGVSVLFFLSQNTPTRRMTSLLWQRLAGWQGVTTALRRVSLDRFVGRGCGLGFVALFRLSP